MSNVLGVILAGGLARRMGGGDKSLNALGTETVLDRVISRLRPQVEAIALNANGDPARFDRFDLPVLPDSEPEYPGPLAGVLAGMDWAAAQGVDHVVSVAADTPFFPSDLVQKLRQEGDGIVLAAVDDPVRGLLRQPTFGQWPVALRDDLRANLRAGLRKIVAWTDQHEARQAVFSLHPIDPFFNINTPEDMVQAENLLKVHDL